MTLDIFYVIASQNIAKYTKVALVTISRTETEKLRKLEKQPNLT